jgi:uncharacterized membrane protein
MIQRVIQRGNASIAMSLHQWLLISSAFSCLLLTARILITGQLTYLFLTWNLFLGFIPYAVSHWWYTHSWVVQHRIKLLGLLLLWLAFVPNSFYIITDLFHLEEFNSAPKWFDLLLIFSFAWNGLLMGVLSIRKTEKVLEMFIGSRFTLFLVFVVMWLNALGIYIGRYMRFNSWDIITQPLSFFRETADLVFHPVHYRMEWGMVHVYAVFMTLIYVTLKKLGEGFTESMPTNAPVN